MNDQLLRPKKKLDVLLISGSYSPQRGGVAKHVEYLANALSDIRSKIHRRRICNVHVLTGAGSGKSAGEKNPKVHRVPPIPFAAGYGPFTSASNMPLGEPLQYMLAQWDAIKPDVIHAHDFESIQIGLMLKMVHNVPLVATIHKTPKEYDSTLAEREPKECYLLFMKKYDFVDCIVAPSKVYGLRLYDHDFSKERVVLIHHGVPVNKLVGRQNEPSVLSRFGLDEKSSFFLCPSRLDSHKGIETLIDAAGILAQERDYSSYQYVIAGSGQEKYTNELVRKLAAMNMENYFRLGPNDGGDCNEGEMATLYRNAKACILPSRREGFGQALLESFVFCTPVIASNTGGIPEVVNPKMNGYLFHRDEAKDLVIQIKRLIENPERTQALVKNAREMVKAKFSAEIMADEYFRLYQKIAGIQVE